MRETIAASGVIEPDELSPEVLETLTDLFRRFREET
jgi:uncharacterized protein YfkK (UPF0435 family)